ncbi:MAG: sigma-70 family RNA polymerase sigma factor [Opitutaceae bacterium]|nr:sigma-70 family RNA polymerase sigma factor [Opitutaceae bacterium]
MTTDEQNRHFQAWLDRHAAVLHHVANGFAEPGDRPDLMQELLLAVWRAVPAFRGGALTSTFVYRVAHNAALTWRRTRKNYAQRLARFEAMAAAEPAAPCPAVTDRTPEALEQVYAAIRQLPPVDRSLILLHLDGVSYAGIAEIHGLSETNVGARLTRLKQKLVTSLEALAHELR